MMFSRQWYNSSYQLGLTEEAQLLEEYIYQKKIQQGYTICKKHISNNNEPIDNWYWKRQAQRLYQLSQRNPYSPAINICYSNFWSNFNPYDNEILNLFKIAAIDLGVKINVTDSNPDIEIRSCFSRNSNDYFKCKAPMQILYLGENVRPNYSFFDYSISMDIGSYGGRNIFTPLWLLRSELYAPTNTDYIPYKIEKLYEIPRNNIDEFRPTCCFVGNNMPPSRAQLIQDLKNIGFTVDIFGSQHNPVKNKLATIKNYCFSLCTENSYHPGYVTEKLIDSFLSGSIPIYWGCLDKALFNEDAFINLPHDLSLTNLFEKSRNLYLNRKHLIDRPKINSLNTRLIAKLKKILSIFLC